MGCLLLALFICAQFTAINAATNLQYVQAKIGNQEYRLEIADTAAKRGQGLSARLLLKKNEGMLFVLPYPAKYKFVMDGMNFPLDFIWLMNNKVVDLIPNVPAVANIIFSPQEDINRVIELNAGEISKNEVKIGSIIRLKQFQLAGGSYFLDR